MFLTIVYFPLGEDWEKTDENLYTVIGRRSDASGASREFRDHEWCTETLQEALEIKRLALCVKNVVASVREK